MVLLQVEGGHSESADKLIAGPGYVRRVCDGRFAMQAGYRPVNVVLVGPVPDS
jgi:hypothetical protein